MQSLIIKEGLILRPMCQSDARFIYESNTPAIRKTFITFPSLAVADVWVSETLEQVKRGEKAEFVLESKAKGSIGLIGVNDLAVAPDIGFGFATRNRGGDMARDHCGRSSLGSSR